MLIDNSKSNLVNENNDSDEEIVLKRYKFETIDAISQLSSNKQENNSELQSKNVDQSESLLQNDIKSSSVIPTKLKIIYSLPAFSKMACLVLLNIHALLFYESLGASLLYLSFFVALARAIEILLKPVIAHLSDKANFKLGRRRPFMLLGMFFYAIFLIVLFYPPYKKHYSLSTSIWFGVFYVLFFIADTVCNVPYLALGPELSTDTLEREKLYIIFYIFQYLGVLFASAAPVIITRIIRRCDCSFCDNTLEITDRPDCLNKCKLYCNLKSNESSLMYICMFIGGFFILSIIILSLNIKENKSSFKQKEESHFVPAISRLFDNKPFLFLIAPWILDVTISTIFATMLPFYLNFIVNPQKYCINNNIDLNSDYCSTSTWLGYSISIFFVFCIMSMGLWHFIVKIIGKKRSWELYSLISILTFSLFLMGDETSFSLLLFISIINAIPAGGAYLNEVFLADIIDYDEFITGKRNEGIYTVFSSFIPKIVSIFASSVPLSIMAILGFIPSKAGANADQPIVVLGFIRFYFIGVPIILAFISFCFKIKYPIDTEDQMRLIREAVSIQKTKIQYISERFDYYRIIDPIFNRYYSQIFCKTQAQKDTKIVTDHFRSEFYQDLLKKKEYFEVRNLMIKSIILIIAGLIFSVTVLITTFSFLEFKSLSFIPLCSLFVIAILIIYLILQVFRYSVINKVITKDYIIDHDFLNLIIKIKKSNFEKIEIEEK